MKSTILVALVVFTFIAGCSTKENSPTKSVVPPMPVVDISTPDKALKSYWEARDWLSARTTERDSREWADQAEAGGQLIAKVTGGTVAANFSRRDLFPVERFDRSIDEVKVETESRAVALATVKNVTPIQVGAEPSKFETEWREQGAKVKYVLEKGPAGWQVSEIFEWNKYSRQFELHYMAKKPKPHFPSSPSLGV